MQLNVSHDTGFVTLHPALRYPDLQNLRVEVAGQVLSQGGNVGADQLADTTAASTTRWASSYYLDLVVLAENASLKIFLHKICRNNPSS